MFRCYVPKKTDIRTDYCLSLNSQIVDFDDVKQYNYLKYFTENIGKEWIFNESLRYLFSE